LSGRGDTKRPGDADALAGLDFGVSRLGTRIFLFRDTTGTSSASLPSPSSALAAGSGDLLLGISIFLTLSRASSAAGSSSSDFSSANILAAIRPFGRKISFSSSSSVSSCAVLCGTSSVIASDVFVVLVEALVVLAIEDSNLVLAEPETLSSSDSSGMAANKALAFEMGLNWAGDAVPASLAGEDSLEEAIVDTLSRK
jgi:hypothetical protein